ncbi:methyltransferase [Clostridia bacterium]|nr:methyltransferase [Clostridia bacterium]
MSEALSQETINRATSMPIVLDPCCGGRMFYFDKQNPNVLYADCRTLDEEIYPNRYFKVAPNVIHDVKQMLFDDETFWHVVFDPPHITHGGDNAWMVKKYGKLPPDWESLIRDGFTECWRVLKINGTLVFKWSAVDIPLAKVLKIIGRKPLYGQRVHSTPQGRESHWLCYVKGV